MATDHKIIALLTEIRDEQRNTRLMMARALAFQFSMAKPMTFEQLTRMEARLMLLDKPTPESECPVRAA